MKHILIASGILAVQLCVASTSMAGDLSAGSAVSSGTEAGSLPEKIRNQIAELSEGMNRRAPQFLMVGEVQKLKDGSYSINGDAFQLDGDTTVYGDFHEGCYAEVRGELKKGAPKVATQIVATEYNGGSGSNSTESMRSPKSFRGANAATSR